MNKKEFKEKIFDLLSKGNSKTKIFNHFSGKEIKDKELAYILASYPDKKLYEENKKLLFIQIALILTSSILGIFGFFEVANSINIKLMQTVIALLFTFFICRGLYKNEATMQTIIFFFTASSTVNVLGDFLKEPNGITTLTLLIQAAFTIFVFKVKKKLFPDLGIFGAKKEKGKYKFSS